MTELRKAPPGATPSRESLIREALAVALDKAGLIGPAHEVRHDPERAKQYLRAFREFEQSA